MRIFVIILFLLCCACSTEKNIFSSKKEYFIHKNQKHIQSRLIKNVDSIGSFSGNKIVVSNHSNDTMYIFATVITNDNMFYSKKNICQKKNYLIINSYYDNFFVDAIHSGVRKFNFIELLPHNSLVINVDRERILKQFKQPLNNGKFKYYYFVKNGNNFDGLVNITENKIKQAEVSFSFQ